MKRIQIQLSDAQYKSYEDAAERLNHLGIPAKPQDLVQLLTANRSPDQIADEFLSHMKELISKGKKQIREAKGRQSQS